MSGTSTGGALGGAEKQAQWATAKFGGRHRTGGSYRGLLLQSVQSGAGRGSDRGRAEAIGVGLTGGVGSEGEAVGAAGLQASGPAYGSVQ